MRYIEAHMTSPNRVENFHSFFAANFVLAQESELFSWQRLQSFSPVIFEFSIQSWFVVL